MNIMLSVADGDRKHSVLCNLISPSKCVLSSKISLGKEGDTFKLDMPQGVSVSIIDDNFTVVGCHMVGSVVKTVMEVK